MLDLINKTRHAIPSKTLIWRWICDELKNNDIDSDWLVEVDIVSADKMRRLNKQYQKIDQPTDALSFPIWKNIDNIKRLARHLRGGLGHSREGGNLDSSEVKDVSAGRDQLERNLLGTIVICYDIAAQQAREYDRSVESEFELLIRHGTLHLIGKHHN